MQAEILTVACLLMMFWCVRLLLRAKDHFKAVNGIAVGDNENPGNVPPETPAANSPAAANGGGSSEVTQADPVQDDNDNCVMEFRTTLPDGTPDGPIEFKISSNEYEKQTCKNFKNSVQTSGNSFYFYPAPGMDADKLKNNLNMLLRESERLFRIKIQRNLMNGNNADDVICNDDQKQNCNINSIKTLCPMLCAQNNQPDGTGTNGDSLDLQSGVNPVPAASPSCVDTITNCASFVEAGQCRLNPAFMQQNCCASCQPQLPAPVHNPVSAAPPPCVDESESCPLNSQLCSHENFAKNCRLSCGLCS